MIMKETIQRFIAACDIDPSPVSMDTLFTTVKGREKERGGGKREGEEEREGED